jgi:hypothetical protein
MAVTSVRACVSGGGGPSGGGGVMGYAGCLSDTLKVAWSPKPRMASNRSLMKRALQLFASKPS